jgi:hypothetical protein
MIYPLAPVRVPEGQHGQGNDVQPHRGPGRKAEPRRQQVIGEKYPKADEGVEDCCHGE